MNNFNIKADKTEGLDLQISESDRLDSLQEFQTVEGNLGEITEPKEDCEITEPKLEVAPDGSGVSGTLGAIIAVVTALGGFPVVLKIIEGDSFANVINLIVNLLDKYVLYIVILVACYTAYKIYGKKVKSDSFIKQMEINADPTKTDIKVVPGKKGKWWQIW